MPILDDFADLLPHSVSWEQLTGLDEYGTPTYAAALPFSARVDYKRRNYVNASGQVVATRGIVIIGGTPAVQPGDLITLPDGSQPPILDAAVVDDLDGVPYHTEVSFG